MQLLNHEVIEEQMEDQFQKIDDLEAQDKKETKDNKIYQETESNVPTDSNNLDSNPILS